MSKFVVDLGKLELSEAQGAELSASIQEVVLAHLAKLPKPATGFNLGSLGPRPGWLGIIIRPTWEEAADAVKQHAVR